MMSGKEKNNSTFSIHNSELIVPQIRFKGFNEEWAEKNLGGIGSLKNGMNFDKAAMGHGHPFVNLQDVFGKNEVNSENLGLAYSTENQRKDYSLNEGDVLFIRSSVKPEGVGEAAVVPKKLENTTYSGFIIRFRPGVEMDVNFNRFVYSTTNSRKQILASSTSSANSNINQDSLQRIQLALPCKPEQTKIGNYFQKLDNLINQHQQKHDKLSSIKKAMLEKMFPKQGETIPEIRFKGFSGEWEVKPLSEVAQVIDPHPSHRAPEAVDNGVPFIGIGDISYSGLVDFKSVRIVPQHIYDEHSARYTIEDGDFAYGRVASVGKIIDLSNNVGNRYTYSPTMAIVKPQSLHPAFLKSYLGTEVFKVHVDNKTSGSTRKSLGVHDFRNLPVLFPLTDEQKAIGKYFQKLDVLINQHQQQITKLNNIKQACLSKMFV